MKIYGDVSENIFTTENGTAVALGKFDGLHKGHRALIERIVAEKRNGLVPTVYTFSKAPKEHLDNRKQKYILTAAEKRLFMEKSGVDILVEQPVNDILLAMEPEDFIRDILVKKLNVKKIFCGTDFRFGHKRKGDIALLKAFEEKYNYSTVVIDKLKHGEREISSTYIREEINNGQMELLWQLLGYPYTIIGVVTEGQRLGRTLGFPTVNIVPEEDKLLPPNGVYFTRAIIEGKIYDAVTNIGVRPSVNNGNYKTVETHILDVTMDMYGKTLELQFLQFERTEKKFDTIEELKVAVQRDIALRKEHIAL